jgi:hypothetical protein
MKGNTKVTTRQEVYEAIDSERDYQDSLWDSGIMANKTIGDWNRVIAVYLRRAEDSWMYDGNDDPLNVVRKIAAVGVHAMEQLGAYGRAIGSVVPQVPAPVERFKVYKFIDVERDYQNQKWGTLDDRNSIGDFITYMLVLSRKSDEQSNPDFPERSLDVIRKITAVAVACMEKFGAPLRASKASGTNEVSTSYGS